MSKESAFSNGLTDAQTERLAILLEELGEAQQAIGKILRHGISGKAVEQRVQDKAEKIKPYLHHQSEVKP